MSNPDYDFWHIALTAEFRPVIHLDDEEAQAKVHEAAGEDLHVSLRELGEIVTWSQYKGIKSKEESLTMNLQATMNVLEVVGLAVTRIVSASATSGGFFEMAKATRNGIFMEFRSINMIEEARASFELYRPGGY